MKFPSRTILDQRNKIQNNCLPVLQLFTLGESWKKSWLKQTFNGIWAEIPVTVERVHRVSYFLSQNPLTSTVTEHRTGEQHVNLEHSLRRLGCCNYITQLNCYKYKTYRDLPWICNMENIKKLIHLCIYKSPWRKYVMRQTNIYYLQTYQTLYYPTNAHNVKT